METINYAEWNKQFDDKLNLDEYIEELGMTLQEFRLMIYNSEREKGMSKKEFLNKVNNWEL